MNPCSAFVLVIDGLGARYLGPYGNTWIETPAFNRLAAESLVAEQAYADSPELATIYRSLWSGRHAASTAKGESWLADRLLQHGVAATFITDDAALAESPGAQAFAERIVADLPLEPCDEDITHSRFAQLFALASERLERAREPFLIWIHARVLIADWDAPLAFREAFRSEDDPPAYPLAAPPSGFSASGYDPDELLPYSYAYAGQIALLDACLDPLLDAVEAVAAQTPLLQLVAACRGYPLGEHRSIGYDRAGLYEELLHIPLFVRWPHGVGACLRTQAIIQPADIFATLQAAISPGEPPLHCAFDLYPLVADERAPARKHALSISLDKREQTLRTKYWTLLRSHRAVEAAFEAPAGDELYLKPDDRCEANEIARRLPQTVSDLSELLDESLRATREDRPLDETQFPSHVWDEPML